MALKFKKFHIGCAALLLLALAVPGLLSLREAPPQDTGSSGVSESAEDQPVSPAETAASQQEPCPAAMRQPDDPGAVVELTSQALEYRLRAALEKPEGDFTAGELARIQRLHLRDTGSAVNPEPPPEGSPEDTGSMDDDSQLPDLPLTDLSDLKYFINLRELDLSGNQKITSLDPLKNLTGLETLTMEYMGSDALAGLSPLADMASLRELNLYGSYVDDTGFLSELKSLETLNLFVKDANALAPLAGLARLTSLDVYADREVALDLSPLAGLTGLTRLNLSACKTAGISPLRGLTNLTFLSLSNCLVTDISPLSGLTALTELHLNSNQIADISPLAGLTRIDRKSVV